MNDPRPAAALVLGTTLFACGATKEIGELDEGGASETGTDDGASASHSSTVSASTNSATEASASESGDSASASAESDGGESDGGSDGGSETGGCGASVCEPQPDGVTEAEFVIDGDPSPFAEVSDLELPCTIESVEGDAPVTVTLACMVMDEIVMHTIEANVPTTLNIVPGSDVTFSHFVWTPFWSEEWFSLRWTGEDVDILIMAGIRGGTILPQPIDEGLVLLAEPFYGDVDMDAAEGICDLEPPCASECGQKRRDAVGVSVFGEQQFVYDGTTESVGKFEAVQVRVAEAYLLENVQCDDTPERWYAVIVVNTSEG